MTNKLDKDKWKWYNPDVLYNSIRKEECKKSNEKKQKNRKKSTR
jgi:hypothetical protein